MLPVTPQTTHAASKIRARLTAVRKSYIGQGFGYNGPVRMEENVLPFTSRIPILSP